MPAKTKTINLTFGWNSNPATSPYKDGWRVEKVTDSIEFNPLQILDRKAVVELCDSPAWKVSITSIPRD